MEKAHSFDMRRFCQGLLLLALVIAAFSVVNYGTSFASERLIQPAESLLRTTELKILEVKARRTMRSIGEAHLLEKLHEHERALATRTIGTASIETLALAHERMIGADLTNMTLYLYENGYATAVYEIKSKGRRGSRWETPTGLYTIESKEEDHFSSIGEVHMPYSMQFFGNFFIHGWPTYPSGELVAEGYSGGCIRMSTTDAQYVFAFAQRGIPIFIWEESAGSAPLVLQNIPLPQVSAESFLIADIKSGTVFGENNATRSYPIASLSKLLVALVANETIHLDRDITITSDDRVQAEGTPGSLLSGDVFSAEALLYPLIMESNNAVAYALARYHSEPTFVAWMNKKASSIGMNDTSIEEPSGLSPNNTSTARDLFKLMRYIHTSQSFILNVSRTPSKTITAKSGRSYTLGNFNVFSGLPQFRGGKTGYTDEARETMTAVFDIPVQGATSTIAVIVLGSKDRKADVEKLTAWFKKAAL